VAETEDKKDMDISRGLVGLLVGQKAVEVMLNPTPYLVDDGWGEATTDQQGCPAFRKFAGRLALLRDRQEGDEAENGLNRAWSLEAAYLLDELSKRVPQSEFLKRSAKAEAAVAIDWIRDLGMEKTIALHIYSEELFVPVSKLLYTALRLAVGERKPRERKNPPMFLFDFDVAHAETVYESQETRDRLEETRRGAINPLTLESYEETTPADLRTFGYGPREAEYRVNQEEA
jgi:hypothetical protein